jgi:predicted TIM-barrel fold metal-dependent hydrolase
MNTLTQTPSTAARHSEHNRIGIDFRAAFPRPKVRGPVIDWHVHIMAARHGRLWFEAAGHYGIDCFCTMTPLEEAVSLQRDFPGRLQFIAIPKWGQWGEGFVDDWLRRIEAFYNLGSRVVKFWFAPPAIGDRKWRLDSDQFRPLLRAARERGMAIMTHIGDPEPWYHTRYADTAKYGARDEHYRMWENVLAEYPDAPWIAAHLAGNPEDLGRLQGLFDRWPNLYMDCSATKWVGRALSLQRDAARDFFIRNQDRILFGTDQVTGDQRDFDFLASRFWVHRKLWETGYAGPSPILDPDLPPDAQPELRGLALPDECLQKLYHDNASRLLARLGARFGDDGPGDGGR